MPDTYALYTLPPGDWQILAERSGAGFILLSLKDTRTMSGRNKRLELQEYDRPLVMNEEPIPEAPSDGAVVKLHYSGVCHSDVHVVYGMMPSREEEEKLRSLYKLPIILGHEMSGEIYSLGSHIDKASCGFKVGDRVMVYSWAGCGECRFCKGGQNLHCPKMSKSSYGWAFEGGFQEYVKVINVSHLCHVPEGIPMDIAALIPCSAITGYSAVMKAKPVIEQMSKFMDEVAFLIVGAGGVGLWGIQAAKAVMPKNSKIFVAEIAESKFKAALDAGADEVILWDPKATNEEKIAVTKAAMPEGLSAVVDFVASDGTVQVTTGSVMKGGTVISVGLYGGFYSIYASKVPMNMLTLKGSHTGTKNDMEEVGKLMTAGKITAPPITHVTLEEVNEVFNELRAATLKGRSIIRFV